MKPSRQLLCSVFFFSMGAQLLHGAGDITIGGGDFNVTPTTPYSPVNYGLDSTLSEFNVVGALGSVPPVVVTNTGNPAGGKITVNSPLAWLNANSLTLEANTQIAVSAAIGNDAGGTLNLVANNGSVALNGVVELTGAGTSTLLVKATSGITQDNTHILTVGGLATFDAGASAITLTSTLNNFGSLNLKGGAVTIKEGSPTQLTGVNAASLDLTSSGAVTGTGAAVVGGLAKFDAGTNSINLGQANSFGSLNLKGGALTVNEINGTDFASVSGTSLVSTSGGAIVNSGNLTVSGLATFSGASINLGGGLGTASVGSLNFNSAGNVTVNLVAGISITGANTAGTFAWNTSGAATLAAGATLSAGAVDVQKGSLVLSAGNQLSVGALTVFGGTTLNIGTFNNVVGTYNQNDTGILAGTATLTATSYNLGGGTVDAKLGTGTLNQTGSTTTLNGTSAATMVNVNGGTLTLGKSDRLANTAAVKVGSATLDLGAFNDTVGSFTLNSGTLAGSGTLSAATYHLNGGAVNAKLGAGILNQTGNTTTLNNTSAAGTVVLSGGTLTLGAAERLMDNATVTVGGSTLNLGSFAETVGNFTLNSGVLDGTGTLTAATYQLNGGSANANLAAGILNQIGGTTALNGTSGSVTVNVTGGTLSLGNSNRLLDTSDLKVGAGTFSLGTFSETVGTLVLNSGTLAGTGTLTAASYELNGGSVNANLAAGQFTQTSNTTTLNGTSGSSIINVSGGTLKLGASDRLLDGAAVVIATATLDIGAATDTVGSFTLTAGTLDGTGILTASTYDLHGGTVNANLGAGQLNQLGGTTILNGTSGAATIRVTAGSLVLGASDRLADGSEIRVDATGTLDMGTSSDRVLTFNLNSGTLKGTGTLTATNYNLNGGTVNANLGAGALNQISNTTLLRGSTGAATVNIGSGKLVLGASARLADNAAVFVGNTAMLDVGAFNDTVRNYTQGNGGTLAGTGTLTAASYNLSGGTVNANLGTGRLNQLANTTTLNGSSGANTVVVKAGSLRLGSSNRLNDGAAVISEAAGILDIGTFNDTVGTYTQRNGALLAGTGTLTARKYHLGGGTVDANLGTGKLVQIGGVSLLNGTSGARSIKVTAGTLVLGAADRLDDKAVIKVLGTGSLKLGASDETVEKYVQAGGGSLSGSGELTVTGIAKLKGGTVSGHLSGDTTSTGLVRITGAVGDGFLRVKKGSLILNGTADADTTISAKGTLMGNGTVKGDLFNSGKLAVDSPGNSLKISGNLVTDGLVELNLNNRSKFEKIKADSISFGGKLVLVNTGAGLVRGKVTIFDADTYSGNFESFKAIGFDTGILFNAETGKITKVGGKSKAGEAFLKLGANQTKANATPLASAKSDAGPLSASALSQATSAAPAPAAPVTNRTSPEVYRSMADYTEQSLRAHVREAMEQAPASRAGTTQGFATTSYNSSGVDGSATNAGYDIDSVSVTVGARHNFDGRAQIGGLLGYDDGSINGNLIDTDGSGFVLGTFGSYLLDERTRTKLTASATYGVYDYDATRHSAGGDVHANGIGSDAIELTLGMSTVAYEKDGFRVIPSAMFRYLDGRVDGFKESGAGSGLAVASQDINSPLLELGVDFDYVVQPKLTLVGHLGYIFDLDDSNESVTARSTAAGGLPFPVNAPGIDNDAFVLGAGAYYDISDSFRVGLTYRGEFRSSASESTQSVGIGASLAF